MFLTRFTRIDESKTLLKQISRTWRCKFDDRKCDVKQKCNNDKSQCECKSPIKHCVCKEDFVCKMKQ